MKAQTHFRIVCLKNEGPNRGISERNRHGSLVMSQKSEIRTNYKPDFQPSLAYLSARLQDEVKSSSINNALSVKEATIKANCQNSIKTITQIQQISVKKDNADFKQTLDIQKYFQKKQFFLQGSKNTMRNLIGSIDFQLNHKKQKRISRLIKSTINDSIDSQRKNNKIHSNKYSTSENRTFLERGFNSFLANKQKEKNKLERQLSQDKSELQLQKLIIVNPQKTDDLFNGQKMHHLNLFHFQKTKNKQQQPIRSNNSMGSKLSIKNTQMDKKMLQKKMFEKKMFWLRPTLKTDAEDFQWSRLHNHKYTVDVSNQ